MQNSNRQLFVAPLNAPIKTGSDKANTNFSPYNSGISTTPSNQLKQGNFVMIDQLVSGYSNAPPVVKEAVNQMGEKVFQKVATSIQDRINNPSPPGGGGGSHSSGYTLSKAPNPSSVKLDSGIVPNAYVSDQLDAEEGKCSPLHLTCCAVEIPTVASNKLYKYFMDTIAFDIQTKAQANIGFKLDIATDFTPAKILTATNTVINALQIYYYYRAIISYQSNFNNRNEGFSYLRKQITPNILELLEQLGRRLSDTPVPPRLFELVRYLSQTYYTGANPGSALMRLVPHAPTANMVDQTAIENVISDLSLATNAQVYTLLRRSVPQWKPGVLFDVMPVPAFDAQFQTLFANLPFAVSPVIGTDSFYPIAATLDSTIPYNSFTNILDGVIYSLTRCVVAGGLGDVPGFMNTRAGSAGDLINTRWSFYVVDGVTKFYSVPSIGFLSRSRPETYQVNDTNTAILTPHLPGADKVKGVSPNTLGETTTSVMNFLMSLDTIQNDNVRATVYANPAKSSAPTRGPKRSGKGKMKRNNK